MNRRTQEITTKIDKKYWTGWINRYENKKKSIEWQELVDLLQ